MRLSHILLNFNSLLKNRGISVPLYDSLVDLSEDELLLWLEEENKNDRSSDILRKFSDNPESQLIQIVDAKDMRVIIYWSQTSGKSFTVSEYSALIKAMNVHNAQYSFVMCLYDKLPQKSIDNIEVFNYNDVISDPFKMTYGVVKLAVHTHDDWLKDNPDICEYSEIPTCYQNDPLVRYSGGRPGNVMHIIRKSFLSGMLLSEETTYRKITGTINKEMFITTGEYYSQ
jgi:hypothetical protein